MNVSIQVPLNTMFADLDESLRRLLSRELERQGFGHVAVVFDAPAREWAVALSGPTLNLFLYDLREATDLREAGWQEHRENGSARMTRPPLRLECSYAVTAWARAIEDEHRLLSQALAVLFAHERLPADCLAGDLAEPSAQRYPLMTRIGAAREDGKADFWNAIGGSYKASIDYLVTLSCEPGVIVQRGPEVLRRQLTTRRLAADSAVVEDPYRRRRRRAHPRCMAGAARPWEVGSKRGRRPLLLPGRSRRLAPVPGARRRRIRGRVRVGHTPGRS